MTVNKKSLVAFGSVSLALMLTAAVKFRNLALPSKKDNSQLKNQVPTLFIHGYAGNRFSSGLMIKRFERYGWGKKSAVIVIKANGQLKITGEHSHSGGFIQVLFDNNRMSVINQTDWLWHLMYCLKNHYGIEKLNIVAHSMGGVTVLNYLSKYGISDQVPHVEKVVTLGVPFNDTEVGKDGEIEYRPLTKYGPKTMAPLFKSIRRRRFIISPQTKFLNVAGDIQNGSASDGSVSLDSVLSLRYLLSRQVYHELVIRDKKASHSMLHENKTVDQKIGQFLFGTDREKSFGKN